MAEKQECKSCGEFVVPFGPGRVCPSCNTPFPAEAVAPPPLAFAAAAPAPASATPPEFPERMKANRALAGRVCAGCQKTIDLGDDVWNCQTCQWTMHQACHETAKGCGNMTCSAHPGLALAPSAVTAPPAAAPDLVPCKFCGEKIMPKAKKCRFCGEYQSSTDRALQNKKNQVQEQDDNLTGVEIAFGVLCGGIACIMAIIWIIQGKKKGMKLLLIALASVVFWNIVGGIRHR